MSVVEKQAGTRNPIKEETVPEGYKRTEVGVIPEDWEVEKLGNLTKIETGSTPPTNERSYYGDEYLFVSPIDITEHKYVTETEKKLSKKGFLISRKFPANTILFVCIGSTIGKCAIAPLELTSNQQINAVFPSEKFSSNYMYYALLIAAPRIKSLSGEQAVPIVNKRQFSETIIPLPPLPEQRAIAEALSDVDGLIAALDKLIAKKKAIKQAAMQQLLTGKVRLPGFSGEWEVNFLGSTCIITKGVQINRDTLSEKGNFPVWNGGTEPSGYTDKWNTEGNTITISEGGNSCGYVNFIDRDFWLGGHCYAIVPKYFIDKHFLYHLLKFNEKHIMSLRVGSGLPNIQIERLKGFTIKYPQIDEQQSIALILSDMDAEIQALERRREKVKQIKQGMMQQLLTGRVRLVHISKSDMEINIGTKDENG